MHRALKSVLLTAVATVYLIAPTITRAAENPHVIVWVYNDAQLSPDTLSGAEDQAARIFSDAGLDITWLNCPCSGGISDSAWQITRSPDLVLHVAAHVARATGDAAFGVAFLGPGGTGRYADVFWPQVQEVHENSGVEPATILGAVMAHEMGHLLLGSNAHAISGIMQPRWQAAELRRLAMGTLVFLPEQSRRMRRVAELRLLSVLNSERQGY